MIRGTLHHQILIYQLILIYYIKEVKKQKYCPFLETMEGRMLMRTITRLRYRTFNVNLQTDIPNKSSKKSRQLPDTV